MARKRRRMFDFYTEKKYMGPDTAFRLRLVLFWVPITLWYWED